MRRFSAYFILASLLSAAVLAQDANMSGADSQALSPTGDGSASSPDTDGGSSAPSPTSGDESSSDESAPTTTDENSEPTSGDESSGEDNAQASDDNSGGDENQPTSGGDEGGSGDDYGSSAENNDYSGSADKNDYGGGGGDYEGPVVTPYIETVIQDVVNTVVEYNTVIVQHTQVHPTVEQVTSINVANVAASQDAIYQVTQTYVCPLPPTVTVDQLNTIWITETFTPTVQVYQTRVNPQVVNQAVTITEEIDRVDVQTQVISLDATAVVTTNMNNMVQVVQQDVPQAPIETQAPPQAILPNAGAAGDNGDPGDMIPNAGAADGGDGDGNGDMVPDAGAADENGSENRNGNGGGHYAHPTHAVYTSKAPSPASNYKHRKAVKAH